MLTILSCLCTNERGIILFVGEQKKKKRQLWHKTPYDGVPGVYAAIQRFLYQFEGPAQLGARDEAPYVPPAEPKCPICGQSMKDHQIDRGGPGTPTYMRCPSAPQEPSVPQEAAD